MAVVQSTASYIGVTLCARSLNNPEIEFVALNDLTDILPSH
jgi:hypothetical protein